MDLNKYIRDIPDFPKKGIVFKDITTLLNNSKAYSKTIDILCDRYKDKNITKVIGVEARGFIIGASLSTKLECGFVPIRKVNKLPYKTYKYEYSLEYGTDCIEIHKDAIIKTDNVVLIDDVLATGGTIEAALKLIDNFKCNLVECAFLIELAFLKGKEKLENSQTNYYSLLKIK